MRNSGLFIVTALLCLYTDYPALAFERPPQVLCPLPQHIRAGAHKPVPPPAQLFIGNISAALLSADHAKVDEAIAYLGLAKQDIKNMEKDNFKKVERMRVGSLDYLILPHEGQRYKEARHVLFPFEDGSVAVLVPELDGKIEKSLKISLRDAHVEFVGVDWDMASVKPDLDAAIIALSHRDSVLAGNLLSSILSKDITVTKGAEGETLQSVYDHIMLADNLLLSKDYPFAYYALYHAQAELRQYDACNPATDDEQVRLLSNEIRLISEELRKENPSMMDKVKENMGHWMDTLQKWMHAAPELDRS